MKQKRRMKKVMSLILTFVVTMSLTACGKKKSDAAVAVDNKIQAIGTVSLDSEAKIKEAESDYGNLSEKDKGQVEYYQTLVDARTQYDKLFQEEQERIIREEQERIMNLVTSESWYGILEGDVYSFNADGKGTHNNTSLEFSIEDGKINIVEGAAGSIKNTLTIDESGNAVKLLQEGNDNYYLNQKAYLDKCVEIQAEYRSILEEPGYWQFHSSGLGYHIFLYTFSGTDTVCVTSDLIDGEGYVFGKWEFVDNNTIKVSYKIQGQNATQTCDIVYEDGVYKLRPTDGDADSYAVHKSM